VDAHRCQQCRQGKIIALGLCRKCYDAAYYQRHRDQYNARHRADYQRHREQRLAYQRAYYQRKKKERAS